MKQQTAVAVVAVLTILVGLLIYLNPIVSPPGPGTVSTEPVHQSYEEFRDALNISLEHTVSSGVHTYKGAMPVPEGCFLRSGATVYADTETRAVITLDLLRTDAPTEPCTSWTNPAPVDFSVSAGAQGPLVLASVAVNSVVIKHTLND